MKVSALCISLPALLLLAACGGDIDPGRTEAQAPAIQGLALVKLVPTPLAGGNAYVGTVESPDRGVLAARLDGRVASLAVREGDLVKAGDLLVTLAENTAGDQLRQAEAGLASAKGASAAAEARLQLAQSTFERFERLKASEAITPQEFDRVAAELEMARQGAEAAGAAVRGAAAGRDAAQTAQGYSRVTAPYAGRVARRLVEEGSTVMPGTPLLALDREGVWRVRAEFPEALSGQVAAGDRYSVELPALGRSLSGTVAEVLPAADPQSRSFQVKLTLEDGEGLSSGLFARVRAVGGEQTALLVPAAAVVTRGQLTAVYVAEEGILRYRLVKLGRRLGEQVEILSGLREGETLVVEGAGRAKAGARVEP
ncbi:RND transporter [Desulfuromonas versatilis]|uniref:RND transporter n=1 Tax=Desulfuromonas versatilis TaxID=2802975 RepID=A0ABM9SDB3_9BACT|nr:efflux RND transporter periplasmic adaptor subunit [Desulfuromonas versatilis]BCR03267.1 RND transporter [Desulfuromonas versatilis]